MYSAHLPIHVEILDAVKYYSSNLQEGRPRQLWVYSKVHVPPESAFKHCSSV